MLSIPEYVYSKRLCRRISASRLIPVNLDFVAIPVTHFLRDVIGFGRRVSDENNEGKPLLRLMIFYFETV